MKYMIPKEAIELAIEGGWASQLSQKAIDRYLEMDEAHAAVALDPTFWEALGKALGWTTIAVGEGHRHSDTREYEWHYRAHRFYDLILTNGNTDKFWADLLSDNTFFNQQPL